MHTKIVYLVGILVLLGFVAGSEVEEIVSNCAIAGIATTAEASTVEALSDDTIDQVVLEALTSSNGSIEVAANATASVIKDNLGAEISVDCTQELIEDGVVAAGIVGDFSGCSVIGCPLYEKSTMIFFNGQVCQQDFDCTSRGFNSQQDCVNTCLLKRK
eukprot:TRINITY_DN37235_c0_g1_i1.p1 TRINITY_DN37235_c0_g1~~TRINITY_DN37235_c0_g1_i1.p1  ORF type:complete len:184 (+),score=14.82 TRINITY_DN37235_c0_g1_i1:77-553(+)